MSATQNADDDDKQYIF